MTKQAGAPIHKSSLLKQPKGLVVLFLTEVWERFSYYGMRALLIFYLTQHFLFTDRQSVEIYATYISLVYLTPLLGGVIADQYLGPRKAVVLGAVLLVFGHFGMIFEGVPATVIIEGDQKHIVREPIYLQIFYLSLAFIITGVGFLKANISNLVGSLYEIHDPRRDSGFTIFYMGINIGAFIAPLVCGYLGFNYGWRYGFGLAGIGMLIGLITFLQGQHLLVASEEADRNKASNQVLFGGTRHRYISCLLALSIVLTCWLLIQNRGIVGGLLGFTSSLMIAVVFFISITRCNAVERDRLLVLMFLMFYQVLFWGLFEQIGGALNLIADRNIDRNIAGFTVPTPWFQSLNSMFIITLAPLFSMMWIFLSKRGLEPSTPGKFAYALCLLGMGFLVLVYGVENHSTAEGMFHMIWLVLLVFLHTAGELCISPVALSVTTKLSVAKIAGMMMGCYFLSLSAGGFVSGLIGRIAASETTIASVEEYMEVFKIVGWFAIGVAVIGFLIVPKVKKYMHGVV